MTEKIIPIPLKQALIRVVKERIKIGILTKRVFIDKGFLSPLAMLFHKQDELVGY